MAFDCLHENTEIHSFHYSPTDWEKLKAESDGMILTMACCNQPALLMTDELGTQYFAHEIKGCALHPEQALESNTPMQRQANFIIACKLYELGWKVETEQLGWADDKPVWIGGAVVASKGRAKVAVEVLWSYLPLEEVKLRQQAYKDDGVRCVWLMVAGKEEDQHSIFDERDALSGAYFHATKQLPIFSIFIDTDKSLQVLNVLTASQEYDCCDEIILELDVFIEQLMTKKISFENYDDGKIYLNIKVMKRECWWCKKNTNSVVGVHHHLNTYNGYEFISGYKTIRQIPLTEIDIINTALSADMKFNTLKFMFSKTEQEEYMANSCGFCGSLMGRFFEDEDSLCILKAGKITNSKMIESSLEYKEHRLSNTGRWVLMIDDGDENIVDYRLVDDDEDEEDWLATCWR